MGNLAQNKYTSENDLNDNKLHNYFKLFHLNKIYFDDIDKDFNDYFNNDIDYNKSLKNEIGDFNLKFWKKTSNSDNVEIGKREIYGDK